MWNLILLILFIGIIGVILFSTFHKEKDKQGRLLLISILSITILGIILINKSSDDQNNDQNNDQFDEEFHRLDLPSMYQIYENTDKKIFFVWVGKYPNQEYLKQIQNAIKTCGIYNPDHEIFLFSNLIRPEDVKCRVIPVHYKFLFKDSPYSNFEYAPKGECPNNYKCIKPALWSDAFRTIILWKYGGSYIDIDDISIRQLPKKPMNIIPACALQDEWEKPEYDGGIDGKWINVNYKWRFGIDPLINFEKGNLFLGELLSRMKDEKPVKWGQILPTKIFKENPAKWIQHLSPYKWHDILYHPKHDGHTDFDKRYKGKKIKWDEEASPEKIKKLLNNYKFPIVKNHNFCSDKDNSVLATLINVRNILIDIGGHTGQSTTEALKYNIFDHIYIFEPVPQLVDILRKKFKNKSVTIIPNAIGIGYKNVTLYDPGSQAGTTYGNRFGSSVNRIEVKQIDISDWFSKNISSFDNNFMKINCEGCEVAVLDSLLDSDEISKITSVVVDFDVKRLFNRADERERIIKKLENKNVNFYDPRITHKDIFCGDGCPSEKRMKIFCEIIKNKISSN